MKFKKNDVFRWQFKGKDTLGNQRDLYWCRSKIFIFNGSVLRDTYWGSGSDCFSRETNNLRDIELTFLGNLDDYVEANAFDKDYYDDADLMDISHANSTRGNFYKKKDAKKSKDKIQECIALKIKDKKMKLETLQEDLNRLHVSRDRLLSGKYDIEEIYF